MKKGAEWRYSIETKMVLGFLIAIITIFILVTVILQYAVRLSREMAYEKMDAQTGYYVEKMNQELNHVKQQQMEFFNDRKLTFLVGPSIQLDTYERRDALLSVKERIYTIVSSSNLVDHGIVYLPLSEYRITDSGVRRLDDEGRKDMEWYLDYADKKVHRDEEGYFLVETGAIQIVSENKSNHTFVIRFSENNLKKELEKLCTGGEDGVFLYDPSSENIFEYSNTEYPGREILEQMLEMESTGSGHFSVEVQGEKYLVFSGGQSGFGLLVQYMKEGAVTGPIRKFRSFSYLLLGAMLLVAVATIIYTKGLIHKPIEILIHAFSVFQEGNWEYRLPLNRKDEFNYLYASFNNMEEKMSDMINEVYIQKNLTQRAQMMQLQAQIAPHFLYNSFFTLTSMIKRQNYEGAQELAGHLGRYFQYLTRNESDELTLQQEMDHAGSYAEIQRTRFFGRVSVQMEPVPENLKKILLPRLTLQPVLENTFAHGLKNKRKDGLARVSFADEPEEYQIRIEDNGEDMTDEMLEEMSQKVFCKENAEVTGLANIHRRLQIFYHSKAGLRISRSALGGVEVTIYIRKDADK